MVLGDRGLEVAWLRPGQGSWSWENSGSNLRDSELVWARSSEPVPAGREKKDDDEDDDDDSEMKEGQKCAAIGSKMVCCTQDEKMPSSGFSGTITLFHKFQHFLCVSKNVVQDEVFCAI